MQVKYLLQRQQPTKILVVNSQRMISSDMRREYRPVRSRDTVALVGRPVGKFVARVVPFDDPVLGHAFSSREHCYYVRGGGVFLEKNKTLLNETEATMSFSFFLPW